MPHPLNPLKREVEQRRSPLDRALGAFASVQAGEGRVAILLALDVFIVLSAYYLLKVVREPLILAGGGALGLSGATLKSAAAGAQAALLLILIPAYGQLARRTLGARLVNRVTAFFILCLVAFAVLGQLGVAIGLPFYVWLGIFNMMAVAQLWSFAADVYTPEQGERLFAIVAFGGTFGAIAGSAAGAWLIVQVSPTVIMLIAAGLLAASILLTRHIAAHATRAPSVPRARAGGFRMVLTTPYLVAIAFLALVFTTVNTNGEYILGHTLVDQALARFPGDVAAQRRMIGEFYGGFFTAQNILTALLQLFVVGRLVQRAGVRTALLVLPAVSLIGSSLLAAAPLLALVRVFKVLENSTDYSLHNTARQALFLPVNPDEKYQAKAAIDTFFVRFGDVLSLAIVAATAALGLDVRTVALINLGLIAVWVGIALSVGRRYQEMSR